MAAGVRLVASLISLASSGMVVLDAGRTHRLSFGRDTACGWGVHGDTDGWLEMAIFGDRWMGCLDGPEWWEMARLGDGLGRVIAGWAFGWAWVVENGCRHSFWGWGWMGAGLAVGWARLVGNGRRRSFGMDGDGWVVDGSRWVPDGRRVPVD